MNYEEDEFEEADLDVEDRIRIADFEDNDDNNEDDIVDDDIIPPEQHVNATWNTNEERLGDYLVRNENAFNIEYGQVDRLDDGAIERRWCDDTIRWWCEYDDDDTFER